MNRLTTSAAIPWPRNMCATCRRLGLGKSRLLCRGFDDHSTQDLLDAALTVEIAREVRDGLLEAAGDDGLDTRHMDGSSVLYIDKQGGGE